MTSAPVLGTRLRATTVEVPAERWDDLARRRAGGLLFERDGTGLAAAGEALRIPLPGGVADPAAAGLVADTLSGIDSDDRVGRPGCGPVALGALPFDRHAPTSLVVPARLVGRAADGATWETVVGDDRDPWPALAPVDQPTAFSLRSVRSHQVWCEAVAAAVARIEAGELDKVVLAREVLVEANRPLSVPAILERLASLYPSCTTFSVDGFVGASPERLVRRTGDEVSAQPLAGTVARSGNPETDDRLAAGLMASAKDRREHAFLADFVADTLRPLCDHIDVPTVPSILALRNVSHLATRITGRLAAPAPSALALAGVLHPTPAVGGLPRQAALTVIAEIEGLERDRYAGPVGWVDARGDGEFVVGIRSAHVDGSRARLITGNGIVAGSDPAAELQETQLKLQALLAAVVRP